MYKQSFCQNPLIPETTLNLASGETHNTQKVKTLLGSSYLFYYFMVSTPSCHALLYNTTTQHNNKRWSHSAPHHYLNTLILSTPQKNCPNLDPTYWCSSWENTSSLDHKVCPPIACRSIWPLSKRGNACTTATWIIRFLSSCLIDEKTRATFSNKLFFRWPYIGDQLLQVDLMESVKENQDTIIVIFLSYNILKKDCLGLTTIFFYFFRFRGKRWDTNGYRMTSYSSRRKRCV